MNSDELNEYRKKIDEIDDKIIELLKERIKIVEKVGKWKRNFNKEISDNERENEIYKRISKNLNIEISKAKEIYEGIIKYCKEMEKKN